MGVFSTSAATESDAAARPRENPLITGLGVPRKPISEIVEQVRYVRTLLRRGSLNSTSGSTSGTLKSDGRWFAPNTVVCRMTQIISSLLNPSTAYVTQSSFDLHLCKYTTLSELSSKVHVVVFDPTQSPEKVTAGEEVRVISVPWGNA
jgi:hypothetical protein